MAGRSRFFAVLSYQVCRSERRNNEHGSCWCQRIGQEVTLLLPQHCLRYPKKAKPSVKGRQFPCLLRTVTFLSPTKASFYINSQWKKQRNKFPQTM